MAELGHIVLYVRELERSRTFYREVVGLYVDDPDYDWRRRDEWLQTPVKPLDL